MNATEPNLIRAFAPAQETAGAGYRAGTAAELDRLLADAAQAWSTRTLRDPERRAAGLRAVAARLRARSVEIIERCAGETGLQQARLEGELARTTGQLDAFAALVEAGDYAEAIIDRPDPQAPLLADVRRMLVPLGPVAVFGASNFPLAFSTAGGDTASALAAGCPVVFKGHPAHPGTSLLVAEEVSAGLAEAGLPRGTFGHFLSEDVALAQRLVEAPAIAAVAFTGSFRAGSDIFRRAQARPRPIPVFAEMGSVNPVVVRAPALRERSDAIAQALAAAISASAGQLCTKPGVIFVPAGERGDAFVATLAGLLAAADPGPMLTPALAASLRAQISGSTSDGRLAQLTPNDGVNRASAEHTPTVGDDATPRVATTPRGPAHGGSVDTGCRVAATLLRGSATLASAGAAVLEERFGPAAVVLDYDDDEQLLAAIDALDGQLTATLHTVVDDDPLARDLVDMLAERCGRLLLDGVPAGVLVNHAMQHGGPWPATSASQHTSVGMTAIRRFLRPLAFQSAPAALLPPELRDDNPRGILRTIDGVPTRAAITAAEARSPQA
jgi:NADP-dependent aldehyde dehydrogenase